MTRIINKNRERIPKDAIYVGRGSKWGNPYRIGYAGSRKEVIEKFRIHILPTLDVTELKGKDLVCFCAPLACHADLLLRKANK